MKKTLWALMIALMLLLPGVSLAASYQIPSYRMAVDVRQDGAALVTESIAYAFEGAFNGPLFTIRTKDVTIDDLAILDAQGRAFTRVNELSGTPGTYTVTREGDALEIKVYDPGSSENRTYGITYRIDGFALRYLDTAEIYYQLLLAENTYRDVKITVTLPGTDHNATRIFLSETSKPFSGVLEQGVLTLTADKIGDGDKVVLHALFPTEWLPDAETLPHDVYDIAIENEEKRVRDAQTLRTAVSVGLGAYAVAFLLAFFNNKKRYGVMRRIDPNVDDALLFDLPPAVAEIIAKQSVSSAALSATLVDLCEMGALTMETREEGVLGFTRRMDAPPPPHPHQKQLLDWLTPDANTLWVDELDAGDDYQTAQAFSQAYGQWKLQVGRDAKDLGYLHANGGQRFALSAGAGVLGVFVGLLLLGVSNVPLAILAFVLAAGFVALFASVRRLTDKGEAAMAAIRSFTPADWDRFANVQGMGRGRLPLAMALGLTEPMVQWMDENPEVYHTSGTDVFVWSAYCHHLHHMERTVRDAQSHNAFVNDPKETGGGGSGGGSPSGGGSSHGAW